MNPVQMALQIRHVLRQTSWPDADDGTPGKVIFGQRGVVVLAGEPDSNTHTPNFPFAAITIDGGRPDDDMPNLLEQDFSVVVAAKVLGDPLGEFAVGGGARPSFQESAGAGVSELSSLARQAVKSLTGSDGAHLLLQPAGTGRPSPFGDARHVALDEFSVTGLCTSDPHYEEPLQLTLNSGIWQWEGQHCKDRFDFYQFRLMWKTGIEPPVSPADADGVAYTGKALMTTHAPVAGRTYAIFADYNSRGSLRVEASSYGAALGAYLSV